MQAALLGEWLAGGPPLHPPAPGEAVSSAVSPPPTWLSLRATTALRGLDSTLPPRRAAAALPVPQTPSALSSCTFTSSHPLGFVLLSSQCPGQSLAAPWVWVGGEGVRPFKSHQHLHLNLSSAIHGAGRPGALWALAKPKQLFSEAINA